MYAIRSYYVSDLTDDESPDDIVPDWLITEDSGDRDENGDSAQVSETRQTAVDDASVDEEVPDWLASRCVDEA